MHIKSHTKNVSTLLSGSGISDMIRGQAGFIRRVEGRHYFKYAAKNPSQVTNSALSLYMFNIT